MPSVPRVSNRLTIQMPKYSAPLPVKRKGSGGGVEAAGEEESIPEALSMIILDGGWWSQISTGRSARRSPATTVEFNRLNYLPVGNVST